MQPLPTDFLATVAKRYDLSPERTEALIKRLGDKDDEEADAEALHISVNALRNRMTGVYTKFSISRGGPGKLHKLRDFLLDEYRKTTPTGLEVAEPETDIDALVQTIRAQVHDDIQVRCGTMRVLDMEQPIGLGDIYTSINILETLSRNQQPPRDEWLKCDPENFDRFLIGQVRQPRVDGLQAVEEHRQLMLLGKPGAGKTTFLKRLAILCNQGEFQPQRVPIFVTLKEYAETEGKPKLQIYIQTQWHNCGVKVADALSTILGSGKALVLLDGLDEVQEADHDRVLQDIKTFAHQFRNCQCVITCRIAAREYTFEKFTEVEVADFDQKQIAEFATKWFDTKQDPKKAETFIQRLKDNKPIQELATNPLLLTLLCLVFGEAADFPANRAELYKEGLDVLLKKWDGKRNIKRDQVYKKLSLKRKEDLLSQLAYETFERGDYFFKQATAEHHIIHYIRNLPGANDDEEALQLDSEAVLKSIEAQHGWLVERARGIYSFSHLTFHEYLTAKHIINSAVAPNQALQSLAIHIFKKRYREIFLLVVSMLPEANELLLRMKAEADYIVGSEPEIQAYLNWSLRKVKNINESLSKTVARVFYFSLYPLFYFTRSNNILVSLNQNKLARILYESTDFLYECKDLSCLTLDEFGFYLDYSLLKILSCANASYNYPDLFKNLYTERDCEVDFVELADLDADFREQTSSVYLGCKLVVKNTQNSDLNLDLNVDMMSMSRQLPNGEDWLYCQNWWEESGEAWCKQFQAVMVKHRDIGHDWQFSEAQQEKLRQYYDANKLLVDCLNSDCYVTKATRQYIEDTLLLPLSEIEKYPLPDAIANL